MEGEVNPVRDLDIICEELRLKDEETLMKNLEKLERTVVRGGDKKQKPEFVSYFHVYMFKFVDLTLIYLYEIFNMKKMWFSSAISR